MLRKDLPRYRPKHKPSKMELELTLAGMLDSLAQSMDAAYLERGETSLTMPETCNASYIITRTELHHVRKYLDGCNRSCMRQKHRAVYDRIALFDKYLERYPQIIIDDDEALESFVREWVQFMNDTHLLLAEQTPKKQRLSILEQARGNA